MQFDLDDLRLVALVAETGSLSAAAKRMHRSLAAVSTRVHNLEQRGGLRFFDRGARGMQPTPAGEALIHHSRTLLSQVDRLHGDLQQYAHGLRAHVRVFANTTAVSEFLPEILARFLTTHPDVDIDLQERLNADIARAVRGAPPTSGSSPVSSKPKAWRCITSAPTGSSWSCRSTTDSRGASASPFSTRSTRITSACTRAARCTASWRAWSPVPVDRIASASACTASTRCAG